MTLRVVQAGYGGVGRRRAERITADSRAVLVGVMDPLPEAREAALARYGAVLRIEGDLAPFLDEGFDALIVSTPNASHVALSQAALKAGAHVLCEKPLARSSAEAGPLVELAATGGQVFKLGANHQVFPSVRAALELVSQGAIGDVREAEIRLGHNRLESLPAWFRNPEQAGGGTLLDNGSHAALLALSIFDAAAQRPTQAQCHLDERGGIDVAAEGWVLGSGGLRVGISSSWVLDVPYCFDVRITGERGSLWLPNPGELSLDGVAQPVVDQPSWAVDTDDFLDAIVSSRAPSVGLGEALRCLGLLETLYESGRVGSPVEIG